MSTKDICNSTAGLNAALLQIFFSDNEIFENIVPKFSDFLLVIQKYVYLTVLQTPVFPLKPQKEVYFFFGSPCTFSGFVST